MEVLDAVKSDLRTASKRLDATDTRTRAMERKLRDVEQLPSVQAKELLGFDENSSKDETPT